mmetsp:Transcript_48439/g.110342  ORF Transcript_48439/g.110342 Transcript_48439/m.110342 type:complete len:521 (+) Transcript_48439:42-1604(+)
MSGRAMGGEIGVALQIVRQHLGDHAVAICGYLVRRPRRTLKELQGDTDLPMGQLRNCLLVLVQHNLVTASIDQYSKGRECRYAFEVEEALLRLRYPKFCAHIHSLHGEDAEKIMQAILDSGRTTWAQIRSFCVDAGAHADDDTLLEIADRLVADKYVTRVIAGMEKTHVPEKRAAPQQKTTTGKRKAAGGDSREERAFKVRRTDVAGVADEEESLEESLKNEGSMWRVNPAAFMWDFRALAIQQLMTDRYGPSTASLMSLLLRTVRSKALLVNNVTSGNIPVASVEAMLREHKLSNEEEHVKRTWNETSEALIALCQDSFRVVAKMGSGADGTHFKPDIHLATQSIRQQIIEEVMEKKFLATGRRIFRLLLERKYLESKTVWDLSMVPKKDANDVLCKMLKTGYIRMQEVPRSADHNAQRTFFLWFVDMDQVCKLILDEMLRTIWVLLAKREDKKRACDDFIGVGGEVSDLTPSQLKQYQALEHTVERLTAAVLRLDETVMIMRDAESQQSMLDLRNRVD